MTTADILKNEKDKAENVIILHREGVFCVAYEHSAWLFCRSIREYDVRGSFVKCVGQHVLKIGFPQKALERLTAGLNVSDLGNVVHVTLNGMPDGESFDVWRNRMLTGLDNAAAGLDKSHHPDESDSMSESYHGDLSGVLDSIRSFPLESRSPMDCMMFLMDLKNRLNGIIY